MRREEVRRHSFSPSLSFSSELTRGLTIHLSPARGGRLVIVYLSFLRRLVFEIRLHRPPLVCSPFLSVWVRRRRVWSGAYHVAGQLLSRSDWPVHGRSADNSWTVDAGRPVDVLTRSPKRRMRSSDGSYARYHHGNLVIFVDFRVGVTTRSCHACFISPCHPPRLPTPSVQAHLCCFRSTVRVVIFVLPGANGARSVGHPRAYQPHGRRLSRSIYSILSSTH